MAITRFTTPPMGLLVKGVDITGKDVYVTIEQGTTELTISGASLSMTATDAGTEIVFSLTQEQAGSLKARDRALVQVNWMDGGSRFATVIVHVSVLENLLDEVIS